MRRPATLHPARLGLEAIDGDIVRLPGGQYRAVLEVGSVDFALRGAAEQAGLIAGFAAYLNGLTYPVQILVRALPIHIDGYVEEIEQRARHDLSDALAAIARDHAAFVRRLARSRNLLELRFYLVVPADDPGPAVRRFWPFGRGRAAEPDASAARRQLTFRSQEAATQLARCGLTARRLAGTELARLYHACWCPELARAQRLERDLSEYTSLAVQAS